MFEEELGGVNRNQVNEVSTPANFASAESVEPITPVLKEDAPKPEITATDGYKSPDFNSYTDEDKNRVATQYGESWEKMSWWDKQRALAHDSWNGALERGEIDEETLVDGIFKDPEIERINKSETEFKSILRDAVKRDVSTMSDDEAQGYYMALVEADPHFRYKDDADGKMLFGEEAQYGRGNLSRLLGVYKGTNPQGLFSREAQKWFNLSDEQKKQVADRERTIKDSVFGMFDENGNIVDSHEQKLMREEKAVQFATLMGSLSPLGQEIVTQSIDKGELDGRTLRLLDEDERDAALAAFRVNKATLDANWWLTQGAAKAWETGSSMVKGTWRQLANAYWFAYWAAGERTPSDLRRLDAYEEEQKQQLKIEDAMRWKYKDNLTFVGDIAAGLMGSAPYMAAMSNPYGGTLAVLGMANDARERMVLSGVDQETALAISFPVGVVEGWIEKLQWNKVFGKGLSEYALRRNSLLAIAKQLSKGKAKYIGGKLLKGGKEAAITTLTEDCEEVLQQLTEDFGVALGKGEFNVREMVEDMWDTAVESFPTTLGFGLMRASGIGPSIHRRYSKNAVIASEFSEYMQGKNAALNVISKVNSENAADGIAQNAPKPSSTPSEGKTDNVPSDTTEAQEGGKSAVYERLLEEMRIKWNGSKSVKARFESLTNAGLNTDQAAIVDEFFRLENEFVSDNPVYNFYDPKDGQIYRNFDIMSLPSIMKGVKRVEQNADGTYNLDLQLDADTIVPVKVERVSRASLRTKAGAQFEKQVAENYEDAHGKGSWAKLDDDEKLVKIYSAVPGGFTNVTVGDTTLPYKAIVSLAAPDAAENDPGAKNYEIGHEIFHAATLVAKKMGIMTDEDLAKMRKVFGEAKIEGYDFDEEKAADEYGKWLVSKANDSTGLFAKIRDFFRKIYNALFNKNGNEQPEMNAEEIFKRIERGELRGITGAGMVERRSESGRFSISSVTSEQDRETKMDREALLEYSRRSIMAGKTKADKVKKILRKHGFSAKEISSLDNSSRFSISQSGKDPADIIAGIVAMKARRGEKMTINQVQKLLASVGADTSLGADILLRGQRSGEKIGDIIKGKAVDDNAFIEMATDEAKRSRMLQFAENVGKEGYRLGAKDEEAINSLLEAKNAAALLVLENAVGFKASEMEQKYGFDLVNSVQNAKLTAARPIVKEGKKDKAGEVNGSGIGLGEMMEAEEAAKAAKQTTAVDAPESAQMESLKNKAAKRADKIDAKYGLSAGMSPAQLQAAKDAEMQAEWDAAHPGEGATTEEKPINKVTVKRDKLDFNRASDFLAFVEEVVAKEIGNDKFENPADIRNLANTAKFFLKKVATKLMYSRDRELIMKDLDGFANIASLEGLESAVMNTYTRIQDRLIPETQEQLIHKLEWEGKQLAEQGVFFSRGGDERNRKVQAKVEEWWRMVKAYLRFSPEAVQEELERLNGIIERRTQKAEADKAATPDSPDFLGQDLEYRRAIDLKNALTQYGGLINKTPGEIADKAEEIIGQLKGSRFELENKREDQYIRTRTMSEVLKKAIINPKAQKDKKAPNPNWLVRMFDSMMGVLEVRFRDLIRFSSGETRRKAETAIQDIEDSFALASQTYNCYLVDNQQQIDEMLTKLYGSAEKGIIRLTEDLPDEDRKLIAKQVTTNTINRSWLLQRYVELQQTDDYAQNISVNKRNGKWREDFDKVFAKHISTDDMTLLVWMRNWYRNNLGDLNNKVLLPISGISQYSPGENYFPVEMKLPTREGPVAMAKAWSPLPSWLTPRVYNNYDFKEETDLLSMWYKRMRESGASIAYAQLGLNINDVLLNPGFKDTVEANHGEVALRRLSEHLTDIISGGASQMAESDDSIAFADRLRAWQTNLTLSCNYVSALKQMTSTPVYALRHDIDFGMVWRFMTNIDIGSVKELMASDGWKSRYGQGFSEAMQNAMRLNSAVAKGRMASAQNFLHHLYNSGFAVMEFGDSVPCVWVGQGLYRYFLAKIRDEEGGNAVMSEMDIKDRAMARTWAVIEMTQQSKRTENLTAAQRGGSMGRFLYQFVSSPVQQLAYEVQAIREALAARGTEHAKEANAHLGRVLVVNHILMPTFLELASLVAGLPLGKIPEKEDTFWSFLLNTLMGQYGCIFLAGMVGENTLNALITGKFDYRAQGLPVMGIVDLFQKVGIGMHDLLMWNNDEFADDAIKILKSIGAPTRHAATAIENWGTRKGEKKRRKATKTWTK